MGLAGLEEDSVVDTILDGRGGGGRLGGAIFEVSRLPSLLLFSVGLCITSVCTLDRLAGSGFGVDIKLLILFGGGGRGPLGEPHGVKETSLSATVLTLG